MSGIAGIVRWDREPIAPELVANMAARISHRGVDGIQYHASGGVSVAYLHLDTTHASTLENQPVLGKDGLILVADLRLDNRDELRALLTNPQAVSEPLSDSQLLLAGYQKWGEDCLDYLIGDFAFFIWNPATQKVFCGRDHSGVRPLFYHHQAGEYFIFASEIKAFWAIEKLTKHLDRQRIASYLCHWGQFSIYQHNTFFAGINSLPPAHRLVADSGGHKVDMYWKVDSTKYRFASPEEYYKAFKETFVEAVRCRIQTPHPVSSYLSGGLDSSSVAAVAATFLKDEGRLLSTYYIDTELEETSEKEYVRSFEERYTVHHEEVTGNQAYYDHLAKVADLTDMPEMFSVTYNNQAPILERVKKANSRILLTGSDGDTVVGYGMEVINDALQAGEWRRAAELIQKSHTPADYHKAYGYREGRKIFHQRVFTILVQRLTKIFGRRDLLLPLIKAMRALGVPMGYLLSAGVKKILKKSEERFEYRVDPILARQSQAFMQPGTGLSPTTELLMKKGMLYQMMSEISEYYDIVAAHHQVQICHPFFDRRLIELCMFIPNEVKFHDGFGRGPLRKAMEEYLPEKNYRRKGKIYFGGFMDKQLADQPKDPNLILEEEVELLEGFISPPKVRRAATGKKQTEYSRLHHRILYFLHWRKAQGI